jgi:hypothetical protein
VAGRTDETASKLNESTEGSRGAGVTDDGVGSRVNELIEWSI